MPKINIVIMSQDHGDPAPWDLLTQQIKLLSNKYPIVIGEERPNDSSLMEAREKATKEVAFGEDLQRLVPLVQESKNTLSDKARKEFVRTSKTREVFSQSFDDIVRDIQDRKLGRFEIKRMLDTKRKVEFYNFIKHSSKLIPYHFLDIPKNEMDSMMTKHYELCRNNLTIDPKSQLSHFQVQEHTRLTEMTKNTLKALERLRKTGGFMFVVNIGLAHGRRLAYYLEKEVNKQKPANITITSMRIFSDNTVFYRTNINKLEKIVGEKIDPTGLINDEFYKFTERKPTHDLFCFANVHGEYTCDEFDRILLSTTHVAPSFHHMIIPETVLTSLSFFSIDKQMTLYDSMTNSMEFKSNDYDKEFENLSPRRQSILS